MKPSVVTLGMSPDLCLAEFQARVVSNLQADVEQVNRYQLLLDGKIATQDLTQRMGGVVKTGRVETVVARDDIPGKVAKLVEQLDLKSNLAYSSQSLNQSRLQRIGQQVKNELKEQGLKSRFRILTSIHESAGIRDSFDEIQLIEVNGDVGVAVTESVQDIDRWNKKDYGRPRADARSGMMPPKVARMLVNLALPDDFDENTWLFDPMCGSGTIVNEGLDVGVSMIGSDMSVKAVDDAKANAGWFAESFHLKGKYEVKQLDATQLTVDDIRQIDGVLFEGYLGPAKIREEKLLDLTKGMIKMYRGVFKRLALVQRAKSKLVCALPEFELQRSVKMFDNLVDSCEKYGYTLLSHPLTYGRDTAKVKRRIYQLEKI